MRCHHYRMGKIKTLSAHIVRLTSQFNPKEEKRDPHIIRNLINLTFPSWRQLLIQEMSRSIQFCNMKDAYISIPVIVELLSLKVFFCMGLISIGRS